MSGWLVWRREWARMPPSRRNAVQLLLIAACTPVFFGAGLYGWALVDIVAMWFAIAVTVVVFWRISRPAAIWWLNR